LEFSSAVSLLRVSARPGGSRFEARIRGELYEVLEADNPMTVRQLFYQCRQSRRRRSAAHKANLFDLEVVNETAVLPVIGPSLRSGTVSQQKERILPAIKAVGTEPEKSWFNFLGVKIELVPNCDTATLAPGSFCLKLKLASAAFDGHLRQYQVQRAGNLLIGNVRRLKTFSDPIVERRSLVHSDVGMLTRNLGVGSTSVNATRQGRS
jgi:hypothetical protein